MSNDNQPASDPRSVLANLGTALKARHGVDAGLAEILAGELIVAETAAGSVEKSYQAILKLADERSVLAKKED